MGIRAKDIERTSLLGQLASHPVLWIPPSDIDFYGPTGGVAGTAIPVGTALVLSATRSWGGASSINWNAAAGAANNATVTLLVTGRDENHEPISEFITLVGGGSTGIITQSSVQLFSSVDSAVVTAHTGTPSANLYSLGIATGTAGSPNDQVRVPHPFRGLVCPPSPNNTLVVAVGTAFIVATSVPPKHEQLLVTITNTNQVRLASCGVHGQDPRSFMEL